MTLSRTRQALATVSLCLGVHTGAAQALPAAAETGAAGVTIDVHLDDERQLTVTYTRPEGVDRLDFADPDPRTWQLFRSRLMRPLDDCARLDETGLRFRSGPTCRSARFRVMPRALAAQAFYEPAQPFSDGSVLLYTRYLAATAPGQALRWRFAPPAGGYVVHQAHLVRGAVVLTVAAAAVDQVRQASSGDDLETLVGRHYVYLGDAPVESRAGLLLVRDPALQERLWRDIEHIATTAVARYTEGLGMPLHAPVAFFLTQDSGDAQERARMVGDVAAGQSIRLRFVRPSENADERELQTRRIFIAHELAHLWNAGLYRSDPAAPWLHEGHAEWASRTMLVEAGLLDAERLREDLELALNRCALVRGERPAADLAPGWHHSDDPYACGMALHALSWAQARARVPGLRPLQHLAALHRAAPDHDASAFARHADHGATGPMHALLLDRRQPFTSTLLAHWARLGLPMSRRGDLQLDERLRQMVAVRLMSVIVERDCAAVRFRPGLDHVWLDPQLQCDHLPGGLRINSVQGAPMLALPLRAWRAVGAACSRPAAPRQAASFHVGAFETTGFLVPCGESFPAVPALVTLTPDSIPWLGWTP